jgi:hypothetical protein
MLLVYNGLILIGKLFQAGIYGDNSVAIPSNTVAVSSVVSQDNILVGGIDEIGGYYSNTLSDEQYVHTIKVSGDFQIIACYSSDETSSAAKLVYPDVVYTPSASYISILNESAEIPGTWKIFITKNILV